MAPVAEWANGIVAGSRTLQEDTYLFIFGAIPRNNFQLSQLILRTDTSPRHNAASELQSYVSTVARGDRSGDGSRHFAYNWLPKTVFKALCCHTESQRDTELLTSFPLLLKEKVLTLLPSWFLKALWGHSCRKNEWSYLITPVFLGQL